MKRPKYVYLVLHRDPERFQIHGCFYSKEAAESYADGAIVQRLSVSTHGLKNCETIGSGRENTKITLLK